MQHLFSEFWGEKNYHELGILYGDKQLIKYEEKIKNIYR